MQITSKLRKVGGSTMLTVPPNMLDSLRLGPGSTVEIRLDKNHLVIEPKPRPRYTLAQLLAECDTHEDDLATQDRTWLDDQPMGEELI